MFNVPSSLSFGVGWALFLLLSFFVREASKHRLDGRLAFAKLSFTLRRAARHLRQNYGKDDKHPTWHHGDHDRIIAHLVAYPLAFIFSPFSSTSLSDNDDKIDNDELQSRMKSKATNDELLHLLLHHDDVRDIYDAPMPYLKCMSVVRSYFTATEPDNPAFAGIHATETPAGMTTRNVSSILLDEIDATATSLQRIKGFRPAVSYVNHLTLFVYIWLGFMPLTLLSSAGW